MVAKKDRATLGSIKEALWFHYLGYNAANLAHLGIFEACIAWFM